MKSRKTLGPDNAVAELWKVNSIESWQEKTTTLILEKKVSPVIT